MELFGCKILYFAVPLSVEPAKPVNDPLYQGGPPFTEVGNFFCWSNLRIDFLFIFCWLIVDSTSPGLISVFFFRRWSPVPGRR